MSQTYGEKLITNLLKTLPKEFYYFVNPYVPSDNSAFHIPDFIIVAANLGVIVLEVKDWKNIREISKTNFTIQRITGEIATEDNPLEIAKKYTFNLVDQFKRKEELLHEVRGKKKLKFPYIASVALTHGSYKMLRQCEREGMWGKKQVLGTDDLTPENFEQALRQLPWAWKLDDALGEEVINIIRWVIDPSISVENNEGKPVGILTVAQEREIKRPLVEKLGKHLLSSDLLTQEAEAIVESTSVRLVRGVAGSGKSLVLARRAQYLAEQYPDLRILVLAFNKHLTADLARRIQGAPNLEVTNFHTVCTTIIGIDENRNIFKPEGWYNYRFSPLMEEYSLASNFVDEEIAWRKELEIYDNKQYLEMDREGRGRPLNQTKRSIINTIFDAYIQYHRQERIIDWADIPHLALAELKLGHSLRNTYDVILIDEAQDFAPSWIQIIQRLLKPDGSLFMCDDPTQSLFRAFSWKQKGVDVVGRTRILRVPFRCTHEITLAAYSLINADKTLKESEEVTAPDLTTYELPSGDLPLLARCRDLNDETKYVENSVQEALQSGTTGSQIAILCHSNKLIKLWEHLRGKGVYVDSFRMMKGLEFQSVFVPHLNNIFNQTSGEIDDAFISETRRRIFTAMTRARKTLILSYNGGLPNELAPIEPFVQHINSTGKIQKVN